MNKIIVAIYFSIILGCNSSDKTKITEKNIIYEFSDTFNNDTIYFGSVRSIESDTNNIYLSDFSLNNVFVLDYNLNFKYLLGSGGRGPSELIGASSLAISNDSLLVYSAYDRKFNLYYNQSFINSYNLDNGVNYDSDLRFVFTEGSVYISDINERNSVSVLNILDGQTKFNELLHYEGVDMDFVNFSQCHLVKYKDYLVLVLDNQPTIYFYNINTNEISYTYTYKHMPEVSGRIKFIRERVKGDAEIVQDISIDGDFLYLLIHTNDPNKDFKWDCNTVLCLNISGNDTYIESVYEFKNYGFSNIEVRDNSLFTIDEISGNFYKFDLIK